MPLPGVREDHLAISEPQKCFERMTQRESPVWDSCLQTEKSDLKITQARTTSHLKEQPGIFISISPALDSETVHETGCISRVLLRERGGLNRRKGPQTSPYKTSKPRVSVRQRAAAASRQPCLSARRHWFGLSIVSAEGDTAPD